MGAVDLVIQVESPGAVSRGLQRIGRAGHSVGEPSKGTIYPKHRGDLLEAAVVARRMIDGQIERTRFLRNPLDVLAQQIVAHVATSGECTVGRAAPRWCGAAPTSPSSATSCSPTCSTCWPAATRARSSPSCGRGSCGTASTTRSAPATARSGWRSRSGGTIPDRGLFGVFLPDGTRVGELDEEMVYESRPGETFLLGASTWRIEEITFERVIVTPGAGRAGQDAVLARRPAGPAARARPGARRVPARDARRCRRPAADRRAARRLRARRARGRQRRARTSTSRPRPPASCPTIARSSSSGSATRSATGGCASSARSARRCTRRGRWRSSAG